MLACRFCFHNVVMNGGRFHLPTNDTCPACGRCVPGKCCIATSSPLPSNAIRLEGRIMRVTIRHSVGANVRTVRFGEPVTRSMCCSLRNHQRVGPTGKLCVRGNGGVTVGWKHFHISTFLGAPGGLRVLRVSFSVVTSPTRNSQRLP